MNDKHRWIIAFLVTAVSLPNADGAEAIRYNRDIRPILADHCFACHGPDSAARKGDLRLDQRDAAIESAAITAGKPDESEMIRRILLPETDELAMPPAAGHKRLSDEQKELLKAWVAAGAEYEPHWSLIAPARPALPEVKDAAWVRNPIDRFVLSKLEQEGLAPAPEADRRTLARRLALDLTGLPPTPEAVAAFVNDTDPQAYEHYVESLLNSPRWGEHRGRYWLDYARFADTHGIHFDNYREMWSYRDWVIEAFNRNLPFDQFTIEQLAGDLLPNATLDQQIATGFSRCNITTNEGGIIDEEYKVLYARDRTETMATVWMGLTSGCCVCHDHKFDPLSMHDFYSMSAFFNNTTQAVRDGNIANTPPIITVPRRDERPRWLELQQAIPAAQAEVNQQRTAARQQYEQGQAAFDARALYEELPYEQLRLHAPLAEGAGPAVSALVDGRLRLTRSTGDLQWSAGHVGPAALKVSANTIEFADAGDFEADQPFTVSAWVKLPKGRMTGALVARMDDQNGFPGWDLWLQENRIGTHIIHKYPDEGEWIKVFTKNELPQESWQHVTIVYDGSKKAAGVSIYVNGQLQTQREEAGKAIAGSMKTSVPFRIGGRHTSSRTDGALLQDLRLYSRKVEAAEVARLASRSRAAWLAAIPTSARSPQEQDELFNVWLANQHPPYHAANAQLAALQQEQEAIRQRGTIAHVMVERNGEAEAFILKRGEYDQRQDRVTVGVPAALPGLPADAPKNRLGLAQWLLRPEHPLTARVTVNRFWQEVFGTGLVRTSGDFGVTGELPSHPELLDWMAIEFRESGWDVKQFFRLMVTSATYRQAAAVSPEKHQRDPENRLLARGPRHRLDAEAIRDFALAVSGLLDPELGGPSVKPYQPEGVWEAVAMIGSNTRNYKEDEGAKLYRRSMYTFWKRSAPPASMDIFNAPSRETCTVRRERTNTPLQALVTLNDPQYIEAARLLATIALRAGDPVDLRLDVMAQRLLSRPFTAEEQTILLASLAELTTYYTAHADDAKALIAVGASKPDEAIEPTELAAYTMLANEIMNLDETLNK